MKKLFRLIVLFFLLIAVTYTVLAYRVVRTSDGYLLEKKDSLEFSDPIVDRRNLVDRIKDKIDQVDWDDIRKDVNKEWAKLSDKISDLPKDLNIQDETGEFGEKLEDLQREAKKRYDKLSDKLKNGKINQNTFEDGLRDIQKWLEKQINALKKAFEDM